MGSITHVKTSTVADGGSTEVVRPSDWNSTHIFSLATTDITNYPTILRLATAVSSTLITYSTVSGLSFSLASATDYLFDYVISFSSPTTTVGIGLAVTGPASPTYCHYIATVASTGVVLLQYHSTGYNVSSQTPGVNTANAIHYANVNGIIRNGINAGQLDFTFRAETTAAATPGVTIEIGSMGKLTKLS